MAKDIVVNLTQMWICDIQDAIDALEEAGEIEVLPDIRGNFEDECLEYITSRYWSDCEFNPFSVDYETVVRDNAKFYGLLV